MGDNGGSFAIKKMINCQICQHRYRQHCYHSDGNSVDRISNGVDKRQVNPYFHHLKNLKIHPLEGKVSLQACRVSRVGHNSFLQ